MLKLILILMITLAAASAQDIPAGAVKIAPNTYRLDEKGTDGKPDRVFLYKVTPFGLSRIEVKPEPTSDKPGAAPAAPVAPAPVAITAEMKNVRVVDLGDSYRFEKPNPFGIRAWTTKKNELTPTEKAIVGMANSAVETAAPPKKAAN